jgi:hypothetical protein
LYQLTGAFENRQGMPIAEPDMIELNSGAKFSRFSLSQPDW